MTITVEDDGSFTFDWDPEHSITSVFNDWTADDFEKMLVDACKATIAKYSNA